MKRDSLKEISWWPLVTYAILLLAHAWTYSEYRQYKWLTHWGFGVAISALIMAAIELWRPINTRQYDIYAESPAEMYAWLKSWGITTILVFLLSVGWAWSNITLGWALGVGAGSVLLFCVEAWLLIWTLENTDASRVQGCPPATPPR